MQPPESEALQRGHHMPLLLRRVADKDLLKRCPLTSSRSVRGDLGPLDINPSIGSEPRKLMLLLNNRLHAATEGGCRARSNWGTGRTVSVRRCIRLVGVELHFELVTKFIGQALSQPVALDGELEGKIG